MLKIANYRRSIWLSNTEKTLQELVMERLDHCPDVASTKFNYKPNIDVQIAERSVLGARTGCYFTLFSEGSPAATVDNGGANVHRRSAPTGEEFLRTGIYLSIEDDHVGYVANGHTNDGQITGLLHKFLQQHGAKNDETQFQLMPRADRREIERLLRVGVKSIDLGMSAFMTSLEDYNESVPSSSISEFRRGAIETGRGLKRMLLHDRSQEEREAASDLQTRIHLGYDGRSAHSLLPHILASIGEEVSDSTDEFKIITRQDVVITRDKLIVKREVNVDGDEIAIDPGSAFSALGSAMDEWKAAGLFEE